MSLGGRVQIARRAKAHLRLHPRGRLGEEHGEGLFGLCASQMGATSAAAPVAREEPERVRPHRRRQYRQRRQGRGERSGRHDFKLTIGYSLSLGSAVLGEMKRINRLHKAQVEQAGFAVLKGQGIPSILVETAFISNPEEEKALKSSAHQNKLARAILTGIKKQLAADPTILNS